MAFIQEGEEEEKEGRKRGGGRDVLELIHDPGRKSIKKIHTLHIPIL